NCTMGGCNRGIAAAACGGLRSAPDCRPRRTFLHLSHSCPSPLGPAVLVTQGPSRTFSIIHLAAVCTDPIRRIPVWCLLEHTRCQSSRASGRDRPSLDFYARLVPGRDRKSTRLNSSHR